VAVAVAVAEAEAEAEAEALVISLDGAQLGFEGIVDVEEGVACDDG
jgi:hypothetical protein